MHRPQHREGLVPVRPARVPGDDRLALDRDRPGHPQRPPRIGPRRHQAVRVVRHLDRAPPRRPVVTQRGIVRVQRVHARRDGRCALVPAERLAPAEHGRLGGPGTIVRGQRLALDEPLTSGASVQERHDAAAERRHRDETHVRALDDPGRPALPGRRRAAHRHRLGRPGQAAAIRVRARSARAWRNCGHGHRGDEQHAQGDALVERAHAQQVHPVGEHADEEDRQERPDDRAPATGRRGTTEEHRGDGLQLEAPRR